MKVDLSEGIRRSQRQRQLPSRFVVYQRIDDDLLQKKEGDEGDNAIDFVDTLHVCSEIILYFVLIRY